MSSTLTSDRIFQFPPGQIDGSGPWLVGSQAPDAGFISSVAAFGVLEPVLVVWRDERWFLVSGWKRVAACHELEVQVPCLSVQGNVLDLFRLYLQVNRLRFQTGPEALSWARLVTTQAGEAAGQDLCARDLRPLLAAHLWRAVQAWLGLDSDWDVFIAQRQVPFDLGPLLAACTQEELQGLKPLFTHVAWSTNKARQVVTWLTELSRRQGRTVGQIMQDIGLFELLARDLSPKDRQQRIVHRVRQARFPNLARLEQEFDHFQRQVVEGTTWRMHPEQHFESNGLIVQARISSETEARQAVQDLQAIVTSQALADVWHWQQAELDTGPNHV